MIKFNHFNFNVLDLDKSLAFYKEALGLEPVREKEASGRLVQIGLPGDGLTEFQLELTWLKDRDKPYDLESASSTWLSSPTSTTDFYAKHKEMGCVCFENPGMGHLLHCRPGRLLDRDRAGEEINGPGRAKRRLVWLFPDLHRLCRHPAAPGPRGPGGGGLRRGAAGARHLRGTHLLGGAGPVHVLGDGCPGGGKAIPHPGRWRGWSCRPSACCSSGVRRTPWRPTCWAAGR